MAIFAFGNNAINAGSTFSGFDSYLWSYADTLSWTRGTHAFRMGAELRLLRSSGFSGAVFPTASGGAGDNTSPLANDVAALTGRLATTNTNSANLLYLMAGSVNTASMLYWISSDDDVKNGTWQNLATNPRRERKQIANEYAFFYKDDWKVNRRLTLNLGLRYEYFGSPYIDGGYTAAVSDLGYGLFGPARDPEPIRFLAAARRHVPVRIRAERGCKRPAVHQRCRKPEWPARIQLRPQQADPG